MEFQQESLSNNKNKTNVKVDFRIMGEEFPLNVITETLKIQCTESWNKGDDILNLCSKRKYTAWIYSTGCEETLDINTQIKRVEDLFCDKLEILSHLKKEYDLEFSIDIVIVIEDDEPPAMYLEGKIIDFASKLGARFDLDTYIN